MRVRIPYVFIFLMIIAFLMSSRYLLSVFNEKPIDISEAVSKINDRSVKEIIMDGDRLVLTDEEGNQYRTVIPSSLQNDFYKNNIEEHVKKAELKFSAKEMNGEGIISKIFPYFLMGLMFFFMINAINKPVVSQMKDADNFGKSKAKLFQNSNQRIIKFEDVAGLQEEKQELYEIVDFLKNPQKFSRIGARIPAGVLLVGPPGTGKTYISRAVAGEAGVPFFSISGSEFLEMYVGVGASRVRDLFTQAKKNAPCIVFIDEIDAVGRKRGSGLGGGHDEREQTLNQLLVEMDGFDKNEGIIIIAATNRPDILDDALLRPGRFDRTVRIGLPDVKGREDILRIHTKDKPVSDDVSLKHIALRTPGFSPAELANLINEAAILSARADKTVIDKMSLEEASIKVIAGPEKKSAVISDEEKKLVSFHEAGHAIIGRTLKKTDPVHMITIIPRGSAGGFTYSVPEKETSYYTRTKMIEEIIMLLGGRAAEDLMLGDISTGASNDIERATKIAHSMVATYGMSQKIGTLNYADDGGQVFIGNTLAHSKSVSEDMLKTIDEEKRDIIKYCYEQAIEILKTHSDALIALANALMVKETIYKNEFEAIYSGNYNPEDYKHENLDIF